MAARDYIVNALIKEVLGPRAGSRELLPLNQDPRDEYITGVLAPRSAGRPEDDVDGDVDDIGEEVTSEEDEDTTGNVVAPSGLSPALDPKSLPRSAGLSFILETEHENPEIELCATWARYYQQQSGWQRIPSYR